MTKIKLPWRRFGEERPEMNDTSDLCMIWRKFDAPEVTYLIDLEDEPFLCWQLDMPERAQDDDRWIYLSEIESPFEEEKEKEQWRDTEEDGKVFQRDKEVVGYKCVYSSPEEEEK